MKKKNNTPLQSNLHVGNSPLKGYSPFLKFPQMALLPLCVTGLSAQTIIPSGNETVETQESGETLQVNQGTTVATDGEPAVVLADNNTTLNNQGTLSSEGITSTVDSAADNTTINNLAGGVIQADSRAVDITGGNGATLNNAAGASIVGTGDQRNGTVYADDDTNGYEINNNGSIDAGAGNQGAGVSLSLSATSDTDASITNTGMITGRGNAGAGAATAGDGLRLETVRVEGALGANTGVFAGMINNSGQITSEGANGTVGGFRAVNGVSFQGTLENSGTISGVQNGVYFGNATPAGGADHTGGVVNNSGTISSDSRAFNIDGTGLEVNNSGDILGTGVQRNGTLYADGTATDFSVNNSGTIDAVVEGSGFAAEIGEAGNAFSFENSGTIQGRGTVANADGFRVGNPGDAGTATVQLENSGVIDSESTTGTTAGVRFVNGISFAGEINNTGTISGVENGLYFGNATPAGAADHSEGVVNNLEGGTISSDSRAFNIDGTGLEVNNSGDILGTGVQRNGTLYADGTATDFSVNNSGTIDAVVEGSGFAAEIGENGNAFSFENSGTIQGRGTVANADGFRVGNPGDAGTATVQLDNSGVIDSESTTGTTAGVRFVNGISFAGEINNTGTISGVQNGLYFGNATPAGAADHSEGVVNNLEGGTISSDSRALNIDGTGLEVNNSGDILGTGNQRNGTVYFDGTATDATFRNTESGVVDAGEGNQGSGISIQADPGSRSHTVENNGLVQGRGEGLPSGASAGLRIFGADAMTTETNVDIVNGSTGTIASETSAGVLIEGVTALGDIENRGTISGATAAIDSRTALGDLTINQLDGRLEGGVFTGTGDDTLNIGGNSVVTDSIDLGAGDNTVNILSGANIELQISELTGDLNVDGSFTSSIADPLNVDGAAQFSNGSEIVVVTDDITNVNLNGPTTILTASEGITDNGVSLADNSVLVDFDLVTVPAPPTASPTETFDVSATVLTAASPAALQAQASLADVDGVFGDSNVSSFARSLQGGIAAGTNTAEFTNNVNTLDSLGSPAAFASASAAVLPDLSAGITRELFDNQSHIFNAFDARLANQDAAVNGVWFQTFGRSASRDGGSAATNTGYDADSFGFLLGYDRSFGEGLTGGLALAYSNIDIDAGASNTDIDALSLNAYGAYTRGNAYLRGAIAYTFGSAESDRFGVAGPVEGDFDVDQFSFSLVAGYDIVNGKHVFSPFVGLEYANTSQDSFRENGGLNLAVSADDVSVLELGLGLAYSTDFEVMEKQVTFKSSIGYYYDVLDEERSLQAGFVGGSPFALNGDSASAGSFELGTSLGIQLNDSSSFSIGYEGEFASDFDSHTGFARFGFTF